MDFFALQGIEFLKPKINAASISHWYTVTIVLLSLIFFLQAFTCLFGSYSKQTSRFVRGEEYRQYLLFLIAQIISISVVLLLSILSVNLIEFESVKAVLFTLIISYFGVSSLALKFKISFEQVLKLSLAGFFICALAAVSQKFQPLLFTVGLMVAVAGHTIISYKVIDTNSKYDQYLYSGIATIFLILFVAQEFFSAFHSPYIIGIVFCLIGFNQWIISINTLWNNYELSIAVHENDQLILAEEEKKKLDAVFKDLHDEITGCPTDGYLIHFLKNEIENNNLREFSLFCIRVRGLRSVQNALGIDTSNGLLKACAQRLAIIGHAVDDFMLISTHESGLGCVSRAEGQEFLMVCKNIEEKKLQRYCDKINETFTVPFEYGGLCLDLQSNVGVSMYPGHAKSPQQVIQRANIAVDKAKRDFYGSIFFDPSLDPSVQRRLILLGDLRGAMNRGDVYMTYQPQVKISSNQIIGLEALIRWNHPLLGEIPPDEFIRLAEQTGMIKHITPWVFDHVAMDLVRLNLEGYNVKMSINVSAQNLLEDSFSSTFMAIIEEYELPLKCFCLELTETAVMLDSQRVLMSIEQLTQRGVTFSIDDFGTGYSSLVNLKRLRVKQLKIDKDFISSLEMNTDDLAIVKATIEMAECLGVDIIAEGVETYAVVEKLRALGCNMMQGFYIAKSMSLEDLLEWMASRPQQTKIIKGHGNSSLLSSSS